jgi:excisionase family DNA binding protein
MPQRIGDRVILSTIEAADMAKLSRGHIQRLLSSKQVEGMKLGHDWLVFEDSLRAYLAQPRKPGPKPPKSEAAAENTSTPNSNSENSEDAE